MKIVEGTSPGLKWVLGFRREDFLHDGTVYVTVEKGSIPMGPKGRSYEYSRPFHGTSADAAIRGGRLLVRGPDTFSTRKGRRCSVTGAGREHISADDYTDTAMERSAQAGGVSAFFWVRICPCDGFSSDPKNCALFQRRRRIRCDAR